MSDANVLLIICDQLRRDSLACHGGPVPTPHLDRLANEGTSFTHSYCVNPMCTPARAVMLSGRFNHALRDDAGLPYWFNNTLLNLETETYADRLTAAGYRCSYIGKWHNDDGSFGGFVPPGPRRQGFDGFWGAVSPSCPHLRPHCYDDAGNQISLGERWCVDAQTDQAIDLITRRADHAQPFGLVLSFGPPHRPYHLPDEHRPYLDEAARHIASLRENVPARLRRRARIESIRYHANIMAIDAAVGRLLAELDRQGLAESTLVVFTADHGECLFSHGLTGKNQFYEEAAAVPLVFRWPGRIVGGRRRHDFVNHVDVAPTLLELTGTPVPASMQGRSLAPLLLGEASAGPNDSAYLEINHPWFDWAFGQGQQGHRRCLVTHQWKLVIAERCGGTSRVTPWQLFDRRRDPFEQHNLAFDPGHQPVIARLARRMMNWMVRTDDPFFELMFEGLDDRATRKLRTASASTTMPRANTPQAPVNQHATRTPPLLRRGGAANDCVR